MDRRSFVHRIGAGVAALPFIGLLTGRAFAQTPPTAFSGLPAQPDTIPDDVLRLTGGVEGCMYGLQGRGVIADTVEIDRTKNTITLSSVYDDECRLRYNAAWTLLVYGHLVKTLDIRDGDREVAYIENGDLVSMSVSLLGTRRSITCTIKGVSLAPRIT